MLAQLRTATRSIGLATIASVILVVAGPAYAGDFSAACRCDAAPCTLRTPPAGKKLEVSDVTFANPTSNTQTFTLAEGSGALVFLARVPANTTFKQGFNKELRLAPGESLVGDCGGANGNANGGITATGKD